MKRPAYELKEMVMAAIVDRQQSSMATIMTKTRLTLSQAEKGVRRLKADGKVFTEKRGNFAFYSTAEYAREHNLPEFVSAAKDAYLSKNPPSNRPSPEDIDACNNIRLFDSLSLAR